MPLIDETFAAQQINVAEREADALEGIRPAVELHFGAGGPPELGFEGSLFIKRTSFAPQTAIEVGEALAESGRNLLAKPDLVAVADMSAADEAATAHAALRST